MTCKPARTVGMLGINLSFARTAKNIRKAEGLSDIEAKQVDRITKLQRTKVVEFEEAEETATYLAETVFLAVDGTSRHVLPVNTVAPINKGKNGVIKTSICSHFLLRFVS